MHLVGRERREAGIRKARKVVAIEKAREYRIINGIVPDQSEYWAHRLLHLATTRVPCSCSMCCNKRKTEGPKNGERIVPDECEY